MDLKPTQLDDEESLIKSSDDSKHTSEKKDFLSGVSFSFIILIYISFHALYIVKALKSPLFTSNNVTMAFNSVSPNRYPEISMRLVNLTKLNAAINVYASIRSRVLSPNIFIQFPIERSSYLDPPSRFTEQENHIREFVSTEFFSNDSEPFLIYSGLTHGAKTFNLTVAFQIDMVDLNSTNITYRVADNSVQCFLIWLRSIFCLLSIFSILSFLIRPRLNGLDIIGGLTLSLGFLCFLATDPVGLVVGAPTFVGGYYEVLITTLLAFFVRFLSILVHPENDKALAGFGLFFAIYGIVEFVWHFISQSQPSICMEFGWRAALHLACAACHTLYLGIVALECIGAALSDRVIQMDYGMISVICAAMTMISDLDMSEKFVRSFAPRFMYFSANFLCAIAYVVIYK